MRVNKMAKIDGRYLREMRERRAYSLRAFANLIYVSKSTVYRWEKSYLPEDEQLINDIAEKLGVSAEQMRNESRLRYGAIRKRKHPLSAEDVARLKISLTGLNFAVKFICVIFCALILLFPALISLLD